MDWMADTIADFGRQLGIENLRLNAQGSVRLELAGRPLTLESQERQGHQEVLVCIGCTVGHQAFERAQIALGRAHAENFPPMDLQLALSGHGPDTLLIAITRLPARAFTATALSSAIQGLQRWFDGVMTQEVLHG